MSKYKDWVERRFRRHGLEIAELYRMVKKQDEMIEQLLDHLNMEAVKPEKSPYSMVLVDKS